MSHPPGGLPPTAVVLDIDGVIAPIGGGTVWGDNTNTGDPETGVPLSPAMCAALEHVSRRDHVGCYWLTDWTQEMRHDVELLPGRSWAEVADSTDGPARAREWAGDRWETTPWWKWWALDEWLTQHREVRRVVWIDDALHPRHAPAGDAAHRAMTTWTDVRRLRPRTRALLVAPNRCTGLTPDDLRTVTDWLSQAATLPPHSETNSTPAKPMAAPARRPARRPSLDDDARPCEGPGSDPQDLLPDGRAWGSRTPPPGP